MRKKWGRGHAFSNGNTCLKEHCPTRKMLKTLPDTHNFPSFFKKNGKWQSVIGKFSLPLHQTYAQEALRKSVFR